MADQLLKLAARVSGLAPDERVVLVYLADCAGRLTRRCVRSVSQIVTYTLLSRRQVYRALAELREDGLIVVVGKTYAQVNEYEMTLEKQKGSG
jgi:CRP-like cAMP-binding protein